MIGIAGPGDPFANAEETLETMRLIRKEYLDTILCLSSNGMHVAPHVPELAEIGVSHVTITINAVDPVARRSPTTSTTTASATGARGRGAAARPPAAGDRGSRHGMMVKVNTIVSRHQRSPHPGAGRNHEGVGRVPAQPAWRCSRSSFEEYCPDTVQASRSGPLRAVHPADAPLPAAGPTRSASSVTTCNASGCSKGA